jgi:hypothetical protein
VDVLKESALVIVGPFINYLKERHIMSDNVLWSGKVDAKAEQGVNTGKSLKAGDIITITASGWIKLGKEDYTLAAPQGAIPRDGSVTASKHVVLKAKIGSTEQPVGNSLYRWTVPTDGELVLVVVDGAGKYTDNSGSFDAVVYQEVSNAKKGEWKGRVDATNSNWTKTGVTVNKGDKISVAASGIAQYDRNGRSFGPDGDSQHPSAQQRDPNFVCPDAIAGTLIIQVGSQSYGIGSGEFDWPAPDSGEIAFIFNDINPATEYQNNTGGYDVKLIVKG